MSTKDSKQDQSTTDVQTGPPGWLVNPDDYLPKTYEEMVAANADTMDVVPGATLIKGDEGKSLLAGVPFMIIGIAFRYSDTGERDDYASLTIVAKDIGDAILNDGSTGIRRQIMDYCLGKRFCKPSADTKVLDPDAKLGDYPAEAFDWTMPAQIRFDQGSHFNVVIDGLTLNAPRGLRRSDYEMEDPNKPGKTIKATTWYLA